MTSELTVIATIFMIITAVASGGALFVSMKVSGSIASFRNELVKELDDRYVRKAEHNQVDNMRAELEDNRRTTQKEKLDGVEIELHRYRDDLDITLKGILAAVQKNNKGGNLC
jgi:hypothetical protein